MTPKPCSLPPVLPAKVTGRQISATVPGQPISSADGTSSGVGDTFSGPKPRREPAAADLSAPPFIAAPFVLATGDRKRVSTLMEWLAGRGGAVVLAQSLEDIPIKVHSSRCGCLVVDLDSLNDVVGTVDTLVTLRDLRPNLMVILVGGRVGRDDFGLDRLPLCDVTLRHPFNRDDLTFALEEAAINNRVWISRRRHIKLMGAGDLFLDPPKIPV